MINYGGELIRISPKDSKKLDIQRTKDLHGQYVAAEVVTTGISSLFVWLHFTECSYYLFA